MTVATKLNRRKSRRRALPDLASVTARIAESGFDLNLSDDSINDIIADGFRGENLPLALVAVSILLQEKPITLRGLFYRVVSAGWLPSTDKAHYDRIGRLMTRLREIGRVPFDWLVDNLRSTEKPPSWSGIGDFVRTVRNAYRMDFWAQLPEYPQIIVEKDSIAGTIAPVTREFDVALSPIRGYVSLSYAHEIADLWNQIEKPIIAYYLGDFDPSGFDLERDVREKLHRYCDRSFDWVRLAVNADDFDQFDLLPLPVKSGDARAAAFVKEHGSDCAELDALPATELRRRVGEAIESHIPAGEWERLQAVEAVERESFNQVLRPLMGGKRRRDG